MMRYIRRFFISPVTWILAITWAIGIYKIIDSLDASLLTAPFVMYPQQVFKGQFYTLLTSIFLHINLFHLIENTLGLLWVSWITRRFTSNLHYLLIFLLSGIGGNAFAAILLNILSQLNGHYWSFLTLEGYSNVQGLIGMSGALYGLLFYTTIVFFTRDRKTTQHYFAQFIILALLVVFTLITQIINFSRPDFALGAGEYAHIGGAFTGLIIAVVRLLQEKRSGTTARF